MHVWNVERVRSGLKDALKYAAAILAFIGGALIILSGYRTTSFLISVLSFSEKQGIVPVEIRSALVTAVPILSFIISLGGILVVGGGVLLLLHHKFTASILIALGGGFGFVGIVIALGYDVYTSGFLSIVLHTDYWAGVLFATIARELGKRS
ncbi:MAG: hypothetical protein M1587_08885 [Thaumarchaeota archaeon]|nr:hypothetical protein [Nitrososphaerota archaeon]